MRFDFARLRLPRMVVLGCLCIALVVMSGMIQAAHFHASQQLDHDCALCMTVHSVVQVTAPIVLHLTCRPMPATLAARPIARPRPAVHFRLASRPPPQVSFLSA
ncbi:MAG: hypothetical protein WA294_09410 [Acidobacteriaceae bacterium]